METNGGDGWQVAGEVVAVVGPPIRYRTQGLGFWAKKPKLSGGGSVLGFVLANKSAGGSYFDGGYMEEVGEGGFEVVVLTD